MSEIAEIFPEWPQTIVEIDTFARLKKYPQSEIERVWHTHDLMAKLFAGRYRGSGRPFINHLAGTAGLAMLHGRNKTDVLASYAHAAYAQGEFGLLGNGASDLNRSALRSVIGDEAEALVFAYDSFDWLAVLKRFRIDETPALSEQESRLLIIRILNELDDSLDIGVYDTEWSQRCLALLDTGAKAAEALGCQSVASQIRARINVVKHLGLDDRAGKRPKKSVTLGNRGNSGILFLRAFRRIKRAFSGLKK